MQIGCASEVGVACRAARLGVRGEQSGHFEADADADPHTWGGGGSALGWPPRSMMMPKAGLPVIRPYSKGSPGPKGICTAPFEGQSRRHASLMSLCLHMHLQADGHSEPA